MIKKKSYNGMLAFGITAIVSGIIMLMISIASYSEIKLLSEKIDFDSIDNNNQIPISEKYYKYTQIWDTIMPKLEKNKNLPVKNMSCAYLDYAQHDIKSMYKIVYKSSNDDFSKQMSVKKNIETLSDIYKYYKNCRNTALYTEELNNMLAETENPDNIYSQERMDNFLNGNKNSLPENNYIFSDNEISDEVFPQYEHSDISVSDTKQDNNSESFNQVKKYIESDNETDKNSSNIEYGQPITFGISN